MFVNRATLIGFLGKDAELRHTRNETPCFWQLKLAHFGNLFWPTPGREPLRAVAFPS